MLLPLIVANSNGCLFLPLPYKQYLTFLLYVSVLVLGFSEFLRLRFPLHTIVSFVKLLASMQRSSIFFFIYSLVFNSDICSESNHDYVTSRVIISHFRDCYECHWLCCSLRILFLVGFFCRVLELFVLWSLFLLFMYF